MKIAVRGGHNFSVPGASGIISETVEDRHIKDSLIKYLRALGHEVLDVTPPDSCNTILSDLEYGTSKANEWGADLYIPCHFNNCYNHYNGAIGSEVYVYGSSFPEADGAMKALADIGFRNRGVKADPHLWDMRKSHMKAILLEICFVEATEDVALYRRVGFDEISKRIAEGISGKTVSGNIPAPTPTPVPQPSGKKLWEVSIHGELVRRLQHELNVQAGAGISEDGWFGMNTLNHCFTVHPGAHGNITKIIQERLADLGYDIGKWGYTGNFLTYTENAVKKFQSDRGLSADGIIGRNTWRALFAK